MRKVSLGLIGAAGVISIVGGISRLMVCPIIVDSRVWAGAAAILLLFTIAMNTLPKD